MREEYTGRVCINNKTEQEISDEVNSQYRRMLLKDIQQVRKEKIKKINDSKKN